MKFVCKICGYVYEGEAAPEQCPVCKRTGVFEPVPAPKNPYGAGAVPRVQANRRI